MTVEIIIELKFRGKSTQEQKKEYAEVLIDELMDTMEGEPNVWRDINDIGGTMAIKDYSVKE